MAGNRDRLRSMSKKNVQEVEKVKDVPTLISDIAERDEDTAENKTQAVSETKPEGKCDDIQEDVKETLLDSNLEPQNESQLNNESILQPEFMNLPVEEENIKVQENVPAIEEKSNTDENTNAGTGVQQVQDNLDERIEVNNTEPENKSEQDITKQIAVVSDKWQSEIEGLEKKYQGPEVTII